MGLFGRRRPAIDWDSPDLQPINGVSLEQYITVSQMPTPPRAGVSSTDMKAEAAGVSLPVWTEAAAGWALRAASSVNVERALQQIMDPSITSGRTHGV
jgi:hypothetical protein